MEWISWPSGGSLNFIYYFIKKTKRVPCERVPNKIGLTCPSFRCDLSRSSALLLNKNSFNRSYRVFSPHPDSIDDRASAELFCCEILVCYSFLRARKHLRRVGDARAQKRTWHRHFFRLRAPRRLRAFWREFQFGERRVRPVVGIRPSWD